MKLVNHVINNMIYIAIIIALVMAVLFSPKEDIDSITHLDYDSMEVVINRQMLMLDSAKRELDKMKAKNDSLMSLKKEVHKIYVEREKSIMSANADSLLKYILIRSEQRVNGE